VKRVAIRKSKNHGGQGGRRKGRKSGLSTSSLPVKHRSKELKSTPATGETSVDESLEVCIMECRMGNEIETNSAHEKTRAGIPAAFGGGGEAGLVLLTMRGKRGKSTEAKNGGVLLVKRKKVEGVKD